MSACQENEMNGFENDGAVYFQLNATDWTNTADSIVYSFAGFKMFAGGVIDRNTAAPSGERARCGGDLFVGIFCLLAAIALPVGVVAVFLSM